MAKVEWVTWVSLAGFALALFVFMFGLGLRIVLRPGLAWGLSETPSRRRYGYLTVAALFAVALCVVIFAAKPYPAVTQLPVQHMVLRSRGVVAAGYVTMIPWIALVWLAHGECAALKRRAEALPAGGMAPGQPAAEVFQAAIDQLRQLWRLLTACVAAAAAVVVVAIVTAGALRAAFLAFAPSREKEYPASVVLLFGAFYAVLLVAVGLPLVISWRARARDLVERVYPWRLGARQGESWPADRAHLEETLHLNVGLLRNPLTILTVFAPVVTSVLALFIPGLSKT